MSREPREDPPEEDEAWGAGEAGEAGEAGAEGAEPDDPRPAPPPRELSGGLALGFLAMVPLILAYELALAGGGDGRRSTAELLLFAALEGLGPWASPARWTLLGSCALAALVSGLRRHWGLGPPLLRLAAEGALGALVIGPILIALMHLLGGGLTPPVLGADPGRVPPPERAAFVLGAGAYEELLFRVGAYSALYLLARQVATFLGLTGPVARLVGEAFGLGGSALLFAAFHLAAFTAWLGQGGEAFDPSVFTWRLLAGILLGLIFRWRGPGVAAWTHGLFNLALLLGAGPEVFL